MKICSGFTFLLFILLAQPANAQGLFEPDPSLPPERVIEIQLQSLQMNDVPTQDTGITQTWVFAHPDNKSVTGPLERFILMIKGPSFHMLLNHREHQVQPLALTEDYALFAVKITTANNHKVTYKWELSKVSSGEFAGSWMTTSVSFPLLMDDAV